MVTRPASLVCATIALLTWSASSYADAIQISALGSPNQSAGALFKDTSQGQFRLVAEQLAAMSLSRRPYIPTDATVSALKASVVIGYVDHGLQKTQTTRSTSVAQTTFALEKGLLPGLMIDAGISSLGGLGLSSYQLGLTAVLFEHLPKRPVLGMRFMSGLAVLPGQLTALGLGTEIFGAGNLHIRDEFIFTYGASFGLTTTAAGSDTIEYRPDLDESGRAQRPLANNDWAAFEPIRPFDGVGQRLRGHVGMQWRLVELSAGATWHNFGGFSAGGKSYASQTMTAIDVGLGARF